MCEVCGQTPCHPACPNAPIPSLIFRCVNCASEIRDGEDYYDINGEPWCVDCIEGCLNTAYGGEDDEY